MYTLSITPVYVEPEKSSAGAPLSKTANRVAGFTLNSRRTATAKGMESRSCRVFVCVYLFGGVFVSRWRLCAWRNSHFVNTLIVAEQICYDICVGSNRRPALSPSAIPVPYYSLRKTPHSDKPPNHITDPSAKKQPLYANNSVTHSSLWTGYLISHACSYRSLSVLVMDFSTT